MRKFLFLFLFILPFLWAGVARAQWQAILCPLGELDELYIKDSTVLVSSSYLCGTNTNWNMCGLLYKSTNLGASWADITFSDYIVGGILPLANSKFLFAHCEIEGCYPYHKVFKLDDGGGVSDLPLDSSTISALAYDGVNWYAGTARGAFISSSGDFASAAKISAIPDSTINAITVVSDSVLVGTSNGLYVRGQQGVWNKIYSSAVHAIYRTSERIFISSDGGLLSSLNWGAVTIGNLLGIDSTGKIFVQTSNGIFLSTDNGSNWTPASNGLPAISIYGFALWGDHAFILADNGKIYLFANNSWFPINNGLPDVSQFNCLIVDNGNIYVARGGAIYKRSLNEVLYHPVDAGPIIGPSTVYRGQNTVTYSVSSIVNATSYIWTLPNGVIGNSNTNSIDVIFGNNSVSGNISVRGHNIYGDGDSSTLAIAVNPSWTVVGEGYISAMARKGDTIFVGNSNKLYSSSDEGNSWNLLTDFGGIINTIYVYKDTVFVGIRYGAYMLTGNSWTFLGLGSENVLSLVKKKDSLFAGTAGGFYLSTDNGNNWIQHNLVTNQGSLPIYSLLDKGATILAGTPHGAYEFDTNWYYAGLFDIGVGSLVSKNKVIYAGTHNGLFVYVDNNGWNPLGSLGSINAISFFKDSIIFAGGDNGVFVSLDNGASWTKTLNISVQTLINDSNYLFAGDYNSINRFQLKDTITILPNLLFGGEVSGTGIYYFNDKCLTKAIPSSGYSFTCWTENGDTVSTDANYIFTVDASRCLFANFSLGSGMNDSNSLTKLTIYPNPTKGCFYIKNAKGKKILIFNLLGENIFSQQINNDNEKIDVTSFSKGIYICTLENENKSTKLVVY